MDKNLKLVTNKVKELHKLNRKLVYKLTTKTGKEIIATNKHKFLNKFKYLSDKLDY